MSRFRSYSARPESRSKPGALRIRHTSHLIPLNFDQSIDWNTQFPSFLVYPVPFHLPLDDSQYTAITVVRNLDWMKGE